MASYQATPEEFSALREEMKTRIDLRFKAVELTIVGGGVLLTIGLKSDGLAKVLLIYPLLVFFLGASWSHNGLLVNHIGSYLRTVELATGRRGWETYLKDEPIPRLALGWLADLATGGMFPTMGLLLMVAGLYIRWDNFSGIDVALFVVGFTGWLATLAIVVRKLRTPHPHEIESPPNM